MGHVTRMHGQAAKVTVGYVVEDFKMKRYVQVY